MLILRQSTEMVNARLNVWSRLQQAVAPVGQVCQPHLTATRGLIASAGGGTGGGWRPAGLHVPQG